MHARTGPRAKYLGATVYKYVPDEIDQRVIQWDEGRKRRSGEGGGGANRAREQSRATTEKYLAGEQIFIRL